MKEFKEKKLLPLLLIITFVLWIIYLYKFWYVTIKLKKIIRGLPSKREIANDRVPTIEEIQK